MSPSQDKSQFVKSKSVRGEFVAAQLTQGRIEFHNGTWFDGSLSQSEGRSIGEYKHGKHHYANYHDTYTGDFLNEKRVEGQRTDPVLVF